MSVKQDKNGKSKVDCCDPNSNCCSPQSVSNSRRDFIKKSALGVSVLSLPSLPVFAGPFIYDDQSGHLIPEDKKLSEEWIQSLYERGKPQSWTGDELKYIGMPIGGVACGQLYLGGDGSLWLWDIFHVKYRRNPDSQLLVRMEQGGHYAYPDQMFKREKRPVEQGSAVKISYEGKETIKKLNKEGFGDIRFRGEYPISKVQYSSDELPVEIGLEAFSPFIPGELEKSANPCTILNYRIKNTSKKTIKVELASWLENAVNPFEKDNTKGVRTVEMQSKKNRKTLFFASESSNKPGVDRLEDQHGYGSMSLSLYKPTDQSNYALNIGNPSNAESIFESIAESGTGLYKQSQLSEVSISALLEKIELKPSEEREITLVLGWYFPYLNKLEEEKPSSQLNGMKDIKELKLHYANRFNSADEVASYIIDNFEMLTGTTRLWNRTWYDSSLPYWLLDRVFIALNCIATNTLIWFNNNRLWGWEGVECCPGTCTHVWQYAQALAHIFPEAERNFREVTDLSDLGLNPDGSLRHRAEHNREVAHDGHCGTIIRIYREHKNSPNDEFLKRNYSKVKSMLRFIIDEDENKNGLLEGKQINTLDAAWYGPMGWISSLYLGALVAGKQMAIEMQDEVFAEECDLILVKGRENLVRELFNGEYFIHKPDKDHPKAISSNDGCHIDQVLGQSFAHMAGLEERVVPQKETISALESIWKYNFAPNAFDYQLRHKEIKGPRIYATEGEAATIMCTWPNGGDEIAVPGMSEREDFPDHWSGPGIYFDEAMNGFEYQVGAHMIYEGLLEKGLATTKAVHDRYTAKKRNPFNEIECSDHYSRSMASYGAFLAVCGFDYHGPKGMIKFDPQISPENFKAPFTVAEGWGSFEQNQTSGKFEAKLFLGYGSLNLNQIRLTPSGEALQITVVYKGEEIKTNSQKHQDLLIIDFDTMEMHENDSIEITFIQIDKNI